MTPQNPTNNALRGTDALNCSTGNPRTGSVAAYNAIQSRLGPQGQPGGGAFFPRLPRYLDSQQDAERMGGSLSFQWQPDENTNITLDGLYSRFDVVRADSYISGLSFAALGKQQRSADGLGSRYRDQFEGVGSLWPVPTASTSRSERWVDKFVSEFKQATLKFDHRFSERFKISGLAGYSESPFVSPRRGWVNIDNNDADGFAVDFRKGGGIPNISYGFDVANPANFKYAPGLPDGTVFGTWSDRKLNLQHQEQDVRA